MNVTSILKKFKSIRRSVMYSSDSDESYSSQFYSGSYSNTTNTSSSSSLYRSTSQSPQPSAHGGGAGNTVTFAEQHLSGAGLYQSDEEDSELEEREDVSNFFRRLHERRRDNLRTLKTTGDTDNLLDTLKAELISLSEIDLALADQLLHIHDSLQELKPKPRPRQHATTTPTSNASSNTSNRAQQKEGSDESRDNEHALHSKYGSPSVLSLYKDCEAVITSSDRLSAVQEVDTAEEAVTLDDDVCDDADELLNQSVIKDTVLSSGGDAMTARSVSLNMDDNQHDTNSPVYGLASVRRAKTLRESRDKWVGRRDDNLHRHTYTANRLTYSNGVKNSSSNKGRRTPSLPLDTNSMISTRQSTIVTNNNDTSHSSSRIRSTVSSYANEAIALTDLHKTHDVDLPNATQPSRPTGDNIDTTHILKNSRRINSEADEDIIVTPEN